MNAGLPELAADLDVLIGLNRAYIDNDAGTHALERVLELSEQDLVD